MENTQTQRTEQQILCDIVSLLESNKVTDNNEISYYCSRLLSADKIRGVKRSVTVQRKKSMEAFRKLIASGSFTKSGAYQKKTKKASR